MNLFPLEACIAPLDSKRASIYAGGGVQGHFSLIPPSSLSEIHVVFSNTFLPSNSERQRKQKHLYHLEASL